MSSSKECPECGGDKWQVCGQCYGIGVSDCLTCDGTGAVPDETQLDLQFEYHGESEQLAGWVDGGTHDLS